MTFRDETAQGHFEWRQSLKPPEFARWGATGSRSLLGASPGAGGMAGRRPPGGCGLDAGEDGVKVGVREIAHQAASLDDSVAACRAIS